MRRALRKWAVVGGSMALLTGSLVANPPLVPVPQPAPEAMSQEDREVQQLLNKLSEYSKAISANPQAPDAWRLQLGQSDVMLNLAFRAKGKERDDWLKMAVDCLGSAVVQSPDHDATAAQKMAQLPRQIVASLPGSAVWSYAALQEVRCLHTRAVGKEEDPAKVQLYLRDLLVRFAQQYPSAAEAPAVVEEAAVLSEKLGKKDDALRCYRYLTEKYAGTPLARKAAGSLWRMRTGSETVDIKLPRLYPTGDAHDAPFETKSLRGKLVVVYFWSAQRPEVASDLPTIKALTDRYHFRGLEVVFVNLDKDGQEARTYLTGLLTTGTHVHEAPGPQVSVVDRYGIQNLPEAFLVDTDGTLIKHSLKASQLEDEVNKRLPRK